MARKAWGGRFQQVTDPRVEGFTESISFDSRLAAFDIRGSQVHARMLAKVGLITSDECDQIVRALDGSMLPHDPARIYARNLEIPSGGGVGTARGVARAYSAFAVGGELGLSSETLRLLAAPARPSEHGFYDECMKGEASFSLGFMKPGGEWRFGSWASFGAPGTGGAMGFADPTFGVGYGYVTSRGGASITGDPRDVALRNALYASIDGD